MGWQNSWIIVNPRSGGGNAPKHKNIILSAAHSLGWQGRYIETKSSKHGRFLIRQAIKSKINHLIIAGGDGTIRQFIKPLVKSKITMGIIPLGTGNVLAQNLGLPFDIKSATMVALKGKPREIDIGDANGHYFAVVTGMGLSVDAMQGTDKTSKSRLGVLAYLWTGLKSIRKIRYKYRLIIDGKDEYVFKAKSILVANMAKTVAGIELAPGAGPHSSNLKVVIITARNLRAWLDLFVNFVRGRNYDSKYYYLFTAQQVVIKPLGKPKKYDCDGDDFPPTSILNIKSLPKSLVVTTPQISQVGQLPVPKKKTLIFDFDGTLADTLQNMILVYNRLASRHNLPLIDKSQLPGLRGLGASEVIKKYNIDPFKVPFLLMEGRREFVNLNLEAKIFPGMKNVLTKLKQKYNLGIVTSSDREHVLAFLSQNDLQFFDFVYSDHSLFGKGHIIKNLMKKYKMSPDQLIYIGDEVRDIQAARESKIKIASVSWGFNSPQVLRDNHPDWWILKPTDLLNLDF